MFCWHVISFIIQIMFISTFFFIWLSFQHFRCAKSMQGTTRMGLALSISVYLCLFMFCFVNFLWKIGTPNKNFIALCWPLIGAFSSVKQKTNIQKSPFFSKNNVSSVFQQNLPNLLRNFKVAMKIARMMRPCASFLTTITFGPLEFFLEMFCWSGGFSRRSLFVYN